MSEEIKNKEAEGSAAAPADASASKPAESKPSEGQSREGQGREGQSRDGQNRQFRPRGDREGGPRGQRVPRFRKKVCKFCHNKDVQIDYKQPEVLERFITDRGKILPRRITGTCAKHQRRVASEIKRARMIALLPFVEL